MEIYRSFYDVFDRKPLEERRLLARVHRERRRHECCVEAPAPLACEPGVGPAYSTEHAGSCGFGGATAPAVPPAPSSSKPCLSAVVGGLGRAHGVRHSGRAPRPRSLSDSPMGRSIHYEVVAVAARGNWTMVGSQGLDPSRLVYSFKQQGLHAAPESRPTLLARSSQLPFTCKIRDVLETHGSAHGVVNRAHKLLKAFGQDPARVYVRPRA